MILTCWCHAFNVHYTHPWSSLHTDVQVQLPTAVLWLKWCILRIETRGSNRTSSSFFTSSKEIRASSEHHRTVTEWLLCASAVFSSSWRREMEAPTPKRMLVDLRVVERHPKSSCDWKNSFASLLSSLLGPGWIRLPERTFIQFWLARWASNYGY
jgi:hypothetical protein